MITSVKTNFFDLLHPIDILTIEDVFDVLNELSEMDRVHLEIAAIKLNRLRNAMIDQSEISVDDFIIIKKIVNVKNFIGGDPLKAIELANRGFIVTFLSKHILFISKGKWKLHLNLLTTIGSGVLVSFEDLKK